MRTYFKLFSLCVIYCFSINLQAQEFNIKEKPAPSPHKWTNYLGEYVRDDQKFIIREDGGHLHAIINPTVDGSKSAKMEDWLLIELSLGKFTYNYNGKYGTFIINNDGSLLIVNNKTYPRNYIEPRDGNTFKVSLDKTIDEYLKAALKAKPPVQSGDFREQELTDVTTVLENVKLDVRYATSNNFLNVATYSTAKSFLQKPALMALNRANKKFNDMGYGLLVHDAYRPWYVTKIFWDATEGPERDFVANPESGSKHNMGSAVDLTLYDLETGDVIKMVGTYDEMSDRSYPDYMGGTSLERWHRDLLRATIEAEGFKVVSNEWWHYDHEDWKKYPILNKTFEELLK